MTIMEKETTVKLKSRSVGAATRAASVKRSKNAVTELPADVAPLIEPKEEAKPENDPKYLNALLTKFSQERTCAENRKARIRMLMERKSSKSWPPVKTQKMVRRMMAADKESASADSAVDQITHRLEQIKKGETPAAV
jgi:hypothetical protein